MLLAFASTFLRRHLEDAAKAEAIFEINERFWTKVMIAMAIVVFRFLCYRKGRVAWARWLQQSAPAPTLSKPVSSFNGFRNDVVARRDKLGRRPQT